MINKYSFSFSIMPRYFAIVSVATGMCLEVNKDGPHENNCVAWEFNGSDHQLWYRDGDFICNKGIYNRSAQIIHPDGYLQSIQSWQ